MKRSLVLSKTIKIALIPMIKTITASNLPQNPQKTKLAALKSTSGKWLFYIFCFAQLQNILQKIRSTHLAKNFACNSLRSFGKRSHFQGPILHISLNICKIIWNVRSPHYLQIYLCTLAMLAHKLGPSLGFFGGLTLFYFGLLWKVGCRYTYYCWKFGDFYAMIQLQ